MATLLRSLSILSLCLSVLSDSTESPISPLPHLSTAHGRRLLAATTTCTSNVYTSLYITPPPGPYSSGANCLLTGFEGWATANGGLPSEGPLTINLQRLSTCTIVFNPNKVDGYITLAAGGSYNPGAWRNLGPDNFDSSCKSCPSSGLGASGASVYAAASIPVGGTGSLLYEYRQGQAFTTQESAYCLIDLRFIVSSSPPSIPQSPSFGPKQLTSVAAVFCVGSNARDGLDGDFCPGQPSTATRVTLAVKIGPQNATVFSWTGPWSDGSKQTLPQGAGLQIADAALPVEAFLSVSATGFDQLNTAMTLSLSFNDGSVRRYCYTGISVGLSGQQCASDCTKCTPTYSRVRLQPFPIGTSATGSCGSCS